MPKNHSLRDAYRHPGFVPATTVRIEPGAPADYIVSLTRRQKKRSAATAGCPFAALTTTPADAAAIWIAPATPCFSNSNSAASIARGAA